MRQYVGARYVPKFFDDGHGSTDWAGASIAYDALTVVTHLGNSFTSKKPVPVGIDITNTDYWASTGIWNAQVEEYRQEVEDYAEVLNRVVDHKYIFIGDSYNTTDTPAGGVPIVPWSGLLAQYLGLSADEYYNAGESGCGFVSGSRFVNLLNGITPGVDDPESITDIVVLGGVNDIDEDLTDVYNAIEQFVATATADYPNAMITLGFISWSLNRTTINKMFPLMQYWEGAEKHPNVRVISNAYKYYHYYSSMYQPDGHPNAAGSAAIARGVGNFLKNGANTIHWAGGAQTVTIDASLNVTSGSMTVQFWQFDDKVTTAVETPSYFRSSGFDLASADAEITFGTFTPDFARFAKQAPVSGTMYVYNGNYYSIPFVMVFDNNTIKLRMLGVDTGGAYQNINGITLFKLNFDGFFTTPIEFC